MPFDTYPAVDENNNFPQPVVEAMRTSVGWYKRLLNTGEDLNTVTQSGLYPVLNYATANSLVNRPAAFPSSIGGATLTVRHSNVAVEQEWRAIPLASNPAQPVIVRRRDNTGAWSNWAVTDYVKGNILSNANMNDFTTPGIYGVETYAIAQTIVNRPSNFPATINPAIVEVSNPGQAVVQTWKVTVGVSAVQPPMVQRRRDNAGVWSEWYLWPIRDQDAEVYAGLAGIGSHQSQEGLIRLLAGHVPDKDEPWRWFAPEGSQLTIPTHEGSGQTCHPSVLYFGAAGWNGWQYWMAHTPYPFSNEAHEDPNIAVSNNGVDWVNAKNNPLDDQPGKPGAHNSDAHIVMLPDNRMLLSWRTVDRPNGGLNTFWQRVSSNGETWTTKTKLFEAPAGATIVSQSLVRVGNAWRLYAFTAGDMVYYESTATIPTPADWGVQKKCNSASFGVKRAWWHGEVQIANGKWVCLISDAESGSSTDGNLYLGYSTDGISWDISPTPLVPKTGKNYDTLYKAGFVRLTTGEIKVYYSAYRRDTLEWRVYVTQAVKVTPVSPSLNHDDRYYRKSELDTSIGSKLDKAPKVYKGDLNALYENGIFRQDYSTEVTTAKNYPIPNASCIIQVSDWYITPNNVIQKLTYENSDNGVWTRRSVNGTWQPWVKDVTRGEFTNHNHDTRYPQVKVPSILDTTPNILNLPDGDYSEISNARATVERGFPPMTLGAGWLQLRTNASGTMRWAIYRNYTSDTVTWENRSYNGNWTGWTNVSASGSEDLGVATNLNDAIKIGVLYHQSANGRALPSLNYPVMEAGNLQNLPYSGFADRVIQQYTTFQSLKIYQRSKAGTVWSAWSEVGADFDTGPRAFTPVGPHLSGVGKIVLQRVNDEITCRFVNVEFLPTLGDFSYISEPGFIPAGFRPGYADRPMAIMSNPNANPNYMIGVAQGSRFRFQQTVPSNSPRPGTGNTAVVGQMKWKTTEARPSAPYPGDPE